jgi:omega-hydroxy-beta-dihydromenaquinone-9 sulfotransferase
MRIEYKSKHYFNLANHTAIGTDLITWFNVLAKNRFAIGAPFIPKALFITATAFFNAPFQLIERAIYSKRIQATSVEKPVFILGHPRSGTTYLQYLFSRDPQFAYCSTFEGLVPHLFLTGGKPLQKTMQLLMPSTRPQDNVRISASLPVEEEFAMASISETSWVHGLYFPNSLTKVFDEEVIFSSTDENIKKHWQRNFEFFLKKVSYRYKEKTLLLKSPANTGRLREIHEVFPDARFVHIHRNPYEVYQSCERLYEKILPMLGFHKADNEKIRDYIFYFYEQIYKKYLRDRALIPANQWYEFSYEEFVKDPVKTMQSAYDHLELPGFAEAKSFFESEAADATSYQKNSYSTLSAADKTRINQQWKFAFEAFGYKQEQ